jgi:hypothetical protein
MLWPLFWIIKNVFECFECREKKFWDESSSTTKEDNCIGMITINDCSSSYIAEHAPPCLFKGKSRRHGVMKGTRAMNSSRHEIAGREIFKSLKGWAGLQIGGGEEYCSWTVKGDYVSMFGWRWSVKERWSHKDEVDTRGGGLTNSTLHALVWRGRDQGEAGPLSWKEEHCIPLHTETLRVFPKSIFLLCSALLLPS